MNKEKIVQTLIALVKIIEWNRFITNGSLEYAFRDGFFLLGSVSLSPRAPDAAACMCKTRVHLLHEQITIQ